MRFLLFGLLLTIRAMSALRTSVIVPCYYGHAQYLWDLIHSYEQQTLLPDEIVISLSQANLVAQETIQRIQDGPWKFPVKLLLTNEQLYCSQNRNRACRHAIGDIFICQDADDIPHKQRVEIIHYFFVTHKVDHLLHQCIMIDHEQQTPVKFKTHGDLSKIKFCYPTYADSFNFDTAHGNPAITKDIFRLFQWPERQYQEDTWFNAKSYSNLKKCVVVLTPLSVYRVYLSAARQHSVS